MMQEQPKPQINNNPPIMDLVIEDMKERKTLGIRKYGVALQAYNGRNPLQDLYEELLDACAYVKQCIVEQEENDNLS